MKCRSHQQNFVRCVHVNWKDNLSKLCEIGIVLKTVIPRMLFVAIVIFSANSFF